MAFGTEYDHGELWFGSRPGQRVIINPEGGTDVISVDIVSPTAEVPYFSVIVFNRDGTSYYVESNNATMIH